MTLATIFIVFVGHFVADFVLQTRWMATNKSSDHVALLAHIAQYSLTMLVWCGVGFWLSSVGMTTYSFTGWILFNAIAHWIVDATTSRLSKKAFSAGKEDLFWVVIGADQLAHQVCLIGSLSLLGSAFR